MDEYPKTGFQKFRESKVSPFVGMAFALLISLLLVLNGFYDWIGGLCIGILSYFVLRVFRAKSAVHVLSYAAILFASSLLVMYLSPRFNTDLVDIWLWSGAAITLPFLLIALINIQMRKNLERTRERLEKEGRLYPPGYGRCKRCGSVVLPGEVCCRRCGEYIDVPEEMRVKKVNYFECSECGREVPEDAGVCPYCGDVFDDDDDTKKLAPPNDPV
jgi:RNA polymerase subunit RPABC4/transcription elongation factor Spt4